MLLPWLTDRMTVEEAETKHLVLHPQLGEEPIPFGFQNEAWKALVDRMEEGDEVWAFNSPKETWEKMFGRAGIAVVREGKIVDMLVTKLN